MKTVLATVIATLFCFGNALGDEATQKKGPLPKFTYQGVALHPKSLTIAPASELERASIIKMEGRIRNPLGKYYLYYSPHKHVGMSLAYSDSIEGPWTEYKGNPIINDAAIPDILWFEETGTFHLWGHQKNKQSEMWTSKDGLNFEYHSTSIAAKNIGTRNATYTRAYEYPLERYGSKYIMLYSGFDLQRQIRCVWLAYSKDGETWTQEKTPLIDPIECENKDIYGPSLFQWEGRNFVVYQDHTAYRGGNVKYVELDQQLSPVGDKGERLVLIEPEADSPIGNRYRECEFYRDGDTIYLFASGGDDPRRIVYATAKVADNSATEKTEPPADTKPQTDEKQPKKKKEVRQKDKRRSAHHAADEKAEPERTASYSLDQILDGMELEVIYETSFDERIRIIRESELLKDGKIARELPKDVDWVLEGAAEVSVKEGRLHLKNESDHCVLWNTREFPESFVAQWDFQHHAPQGVEANKRIYVAVECQDPDGGFIDPETHAGVNDLNGVLSVTLMVDGRVVQTKTNAKEPVAGNETAARGFGLYEFWVTLPIGKHNLQIETVDRKNNHRVGSRVTIDAQEGALPQPPEFGGPIRGDAYVGESFTASIAGTARDLDGDALTYSKVSGPDWLIVAGDGSISGTPTPNDVGMNTFTLGVSSADGTDEGTLSVKVLPESTILVGSDFEAETVGGQPGDFLYDTSGGSVEVVDEMGKKYLRMKDTSNDDGLGNVIKQSFDPQLGLVTVQLRMRAAASKDQMYLSLFDADGKRALKVGYSGELQRGNGLHKYLEPASTKSDHLETFRPKSWYERGIWYRFRIEADVHTQRYRFWVNDIEMLPQDNSLTDFPFYDATGDITRFELTNLSAEGTFDIDSISIRGGQAYNARCGSRKLSDGRVKPDPCFVPSSAHSDSAQGETYESLATPPAGAAEVLSGTFTSALLGKEVPYRIFASAKPEVSNAGMPIAIYTLNLECTEPRPSSATDREIIEDLIQRQFLVVAVDFTGGKVTDHLEWAKDTHGLIQVFGGKSHSEQPYYTKHRKALIQIPGPHAGKEMESVPSPDPSVGKTLPIRKNRMYLLPPGYTVEYHHIFNPNSGIDQRPEFYFDIIYPMPSEKHRKVPVLLAQSATNTGDVVVNANSFVLYSWLFNGYAVAITKNLPPAEDNLHIYPIVQAIRYLRWKADDFSLNGVVSTAGISKAARRAFRESHFNGQASVMDNGALPFCKQSSKVSITMPAVGAGSLLDSPGYPDYPIWENLNENSPAVVLGYHHLNPKDVEKHHGRKEKLVRDAYLAKGWENRMLYLDVPLGAHEYTFTT